MKAIALSLLIQMMLWYFPANALKNDNHVPIRIHPTIEKQYSEADIYALLGEIISLEQSELISIDVFGIHSDLNDVAMTTIVIVSDQQIDSMAKGESYVLDSEKVWFEDDEKQSGLYFRLKSGTALTGPEESSRANSREFRSCFFIDLVTKSTNHLYYALNLYVR